MSNFQSIPSKSISTAPQVRKHIDQALIQELADSIKSQGLLQPILVRPAKKGKYLVVAGERRFRACQFAGLTEIMCHVKLMTDDEALEAQITENLQRKDVNPIVEAARARQAKRKASLEKLLAEL